MFLTQAEETLDHSDSLEDVEIVSPGENVKANLADVIDSDSESFSAEAVAGLEIDTPDVPNETPTPYTSNSALSNRYSSVQDV